MVPGMGWEGWARRPLTWHRLEPQRTNPPGEGGGEPTGEEGSCHLGRAGVAEATPVAALGGLNRVRWPGGKTGSM